MLYICEFACVHLVDVGHPSLGGGQVVPPPVYLYLIPVVRCCCMFQRIGGYCFFPRPYCSLRSVAANGLCLYCSLRSVAANGFCVVSALKPRRLLYDIARAQCAAVERRSRPLAAAPWSVTSPAAMRRPQPPPTPPRTPSLATLPPPVRTASVFCASQASPARFLPALIARSARSLLMACACIARSARSLLMAFAWCQP